jgi:hypothetical protein
MSIFRILKIINILFLDSQPLAETTETLRIRRPTETGLISFLNLSLCENVQKVQK